MLLKMICYIMFFVAVWRVSQCLTKVLCCKVESELKKKKSLTKLNS